MCCGPDWILGYGYRSLHVVLILHLNAPSKMIHLSGCKSCEGFVSIHSEAQNLRLCRSINFVVLLIKRFL